MAGYTASSNFPHGGGVFQAAKNAGEDAFVPKLDATGATLPFSTFLGGSGDDYALAIVVDAAGTVYVAGDTTSTDFPKSADAAQAVSQGGDFTSFLSILNPTGAVLNYGTYFGGGDHETAFGLTLAQSGQIFVVGYTSSSDFPVTAGVLQSSRGGREDAFIASFSNRTAQPPTADSVTPNGGVGTAQNFAFKYSSANGYAYLNTVEALINASSSATGACYVYYVAASRSLYLENDVGTGATGPLTPGAAGTLQNSQCSIDGAGSSAAGSGNTLTLVVAATFKSSFAGNQNLFGRAADGGNSSSGWQNLGSWRSGPAANTAPTADSVTPNGGAGTSQNFTFKYSSVNGFGYLNVTYALINGASAGPPGAWRTISSNRICCICLTTPGTR